MNFAVTGLENGVSTDRTADATLGTAEERTTVVGPSIRFESDRHYIARRRHISILAASGLDADGHICKSLITRLIIH